MLKWGQDARHRGRSCSGSPTPILAAAGGQQERIRSKGAAAPCSENGTPVGEEGMDGWIGSRTNPALAAAACSKASRVSESAADDVELGAGGIRQT